VWDKIKWAIVGALVTGVIALGFKYAPQILQFLF
jgi:hypothetical protein